MKPLTYILTIPFLIAVLVSCDRIQRRSEQVGEKVKQKTKAALKAQTQRVIDKVFPPFDHDQPDTENNKERFNDFVKIDLTPDIRNIYCFDDAVGANADYMFAFNCDSATSNKVIEQHNLTIDTTNADNGFGLQHDFEWWDKTRIATLQKYSWTNGEQYFKYYWYDGERQQAYFFDFDL